MLNSTEKELIYLFLPFFHLFSFALPSVIFASDGRGNITRIRLDLCRNRELTNQTHSCHFLYTFSHVVSLSYLFSVRLLKPKVVVSLKVLLFLQEKLSLSFRVVHILLHHLIIGGNPENHSHYIGRLRSRSRTS